MASASSLPLDAEAFAAGAATERDRIRAILAHPEAKSRQATALAFALDTDMSVEAAIGALATIPATGTALGLAERAAAFTASLPMLGVSVGPANGPSTDFEKGVAIAQRLRAAKG